MTDGIAIFAGIFTWSFMEYVLHRWAGHDRRWSSRAEFGREHIRHHREGGYFAPAWKKAILAVLVVPLLAVPASWVAGTRAGTLYAIGFVAFYLFYEWFHHRLHVAAGIGPVGRWARKHHFYHHFHKATVNHGVTSPLWDWVFGTLVWPEVVVVPERLAMPWLRDANGGWGERHARDFVVRGREGG
jgi:hypothetical protein